jgi:oligo-1,6-glucosidase
MSRDNGRTPMQWDASPHAGFTAGTPWIAVNPNHDEINAAAAVADPESVFHHYRRLIELRHTEPVVAHGDFTMLLEDDERIYAFARRLDSTELLVVANFSGDAIDYDWPDDELLLGNCPHLGPGLQPWEARIYRRTSTAAG